MSVEQFPVHLHGKATRQEGGVVWPQPPNIVEETSRGGGVVSERGKKLAVNDRRSWWTIRSVPTRFMA